MAAVSFVVILVRIFSFVALVSRFACNTRVTVDASSDPPVSQIAVTKT